MIKEGVMQWMMKLSACECMRKGMEEVNKNRRD
jgi:hypothetical protein